MIAKIKDLRYIKNDEFIKGYISSDICDESTANKILKGLTNIKDVNKSTEFDITSIEEFAGVDYQYYVLENNLGAYLIREDNVDLTEEPEDVLNYYGYSKLIKNGTKTILIDQDGCKYMTTRHLEDEDDPEKAVMIVLLKSLGFSIKDIDKMVEAIQK